MENRILLIVNKKAGKGKIGKHVQDIENNLKKLNYSVTTKYTTKENNAKVIITNYQDPYDIVVACGGDGTLSEVVQGILEMKKDAAIGYIPMGTMNDFAKSMGISFNKFDISNNINDYEVKHCDLGVFDDKIFNYSATFGMFSKASYSADSKYKNKFGKLAYWWLAAKELFDYQSYNVKAEFDEKVIEDDFIFGCISNSKYVGGMHLFKNEPIEMDDGKFEVLLVKKPKNFIHTLKLTLKVMNGNFKDEYIHYYQTSDLSVESDNNIRWALDGEDGGNVNNVKLHNLNRAINYIVPKNKKNTL